MPEKGNFNLTWSEKNKNCYGSAVMEINKATMEQEI
jgi:hypothetical protein